VLHPQPARSYGSLRIAVGEQGGGKMALCVAALRHDGITAWRYGGMAVWRYGRMVLLLRGCVAARLRSNLPLRQPEVVEPTQRCQVTAMRSEP